jgi:hypothetical protein
VYASAPDVDGGLTQAPNRDLLFTEYPDNLVGELTSSGATPDTYAAPIQQSTGALTFIPGGINGAGDAVFTSYNAGMICTSAASLNAKNEYTFASCTASVTVTGVAEGIVYVPASVGGFAAPTILVSQALGPYVTVNAYQVGSNGLPVLSSASLFFSGSINEGLALDPVTGDILGTSYYQGTNYAYVYDIFATSAQPVPEPSTFALALLLICATGARVYFSAKPFTVPTTKVCPPTTTSRSPTDAYCTTRTA